MGRRATRKHGAGGAGSAADAVAAVRERIARGSTKGALEDAKKLAKRKPGPESDALLAEAYTARAAALEKGGMRREACELLAVARRRLPGRAAGFEAREKDLALRAGDLSQTLRAWSRGDAPRDELGAIVAAHAVDLARIAGAPELAEEDPLRRAARTLQSAFAEAAGGQLSEAARISLRAVPRSSPLSAWRSLTLAIAAFHQRNDGEVREHLQRIPETAAVRPVADLLRRCVEGRDTEGLGPAARHLLERLSGTAQGERDGLEGLRDALAREDEDDAAAAAARLLAALAARDGRLARRFARWIAMELGSRQRILSHALQRTLGNEWTRLYALENAVSEPLAGLSWLFWLIPGPTQPLRRLDDTEMALVLERLAPAVDAFFEELTPRLLEAGLGDHVCDPSTREGGKRLAEGLMKLFGEEEPTAGVPLMIAHLMQGLGERVRPLPLPWRTPGARILQVASELDPTPERFRALLDDARRLPSRERRSLLEGWAARLPGDIQPLLLLVEDAERRSARRQAERCLERAERLAPVDERVRAARFRVLVSSLHAHLRAGKPHLCARDLEKLEATPAASGAERALHLAAARCRVAELEGRGQEARAGLESACGDSTKAEVMLRLLDALVQERGIDMSGIPAGPRAVAPVVLLLRVLGAVAPDCQPVDVGKHLIGCTETDFPSHPADLALLCSALTRPEDADLLHLGSGLGLRSQGMLLPRFLLYRWWALRGSSRWKRQAGEVRRLALALAGRYQDREVVRALGPVSLEDLDPPGEAEGDAWLRRERGLVGTLAERAARSRTSEPAESRGSRRRRRDPKGRLGFLPFPPRELEAEA